MSDENSFILQYAATFMATQAAARINQFERDHANGDPRTRPFVPLEPDVMDAGRAYDAARAAWTAYCRHAQERYRTILR